MRTPTTLSDEGAAGGTATEAPYPGLRPFEPRDSEFFLGRETQVQQLMLRLRDTRFLAVIGESGSGKSSLVRAGLLPALEKGFLFQAGPRWKHILAEPGDDPFGRLARELARLGGTAGTASSALFEAVLRSSGAGLSECARSVLEPDENLLVVMDQFEEIFPQKLKRGASAFEDRAAFVQVLLEAAERRGPVYVLLTMRSDFLGRCQEFVGLPEAMNRSQFLVPRMNREELRLAIRGPARILGVNVSAAVLDVLLNEVGNDQDQLPVLQHALAQSWDRWSRRTGGPADIDYHLDYQPTGGIQGALDQHAEALYGQLTPRQQTIARKLFQTVTVKPPDSESVRRPTRLSKAKAGEANIFDILTAVPELQGLTLGEIRAVIENFRKGCNFLRPYTHTEPELRDYTRIDISHESLMRKWSRLMGWIQAEQRVALAYRELVVAARRYYNQEPGEVGGLWDDPELSDVRKRLEEHPWSLPWALQYSSADDYRLSRKFLEEGIARREQARRRRRLPVLVALGLLPLLALATGVAFWQSQLASRQSQLASQRAVTAEQSNKAAEASLAQAKTSRRQMELAYADAQAAETVAEAQRALAESAKKSAVLALAQARNQKEVAESATAAATESAKQLTVALIEAKEQRAEAETARKQAEANEARAEQGAKDLAEASKQIQQAEVRKRQSQVTDARLGAEGLKTMWDWGNQDGLVGGASWSRALAKLLDSADELAKSGILLKSSVQALRFGLMRSMALDTAAAFAPVAAASVGDDSTVFISRDARVYHWYPDPAFRLQNDFTKLRLDVDLSHPLRGQALNLNHFALSSDGMVALAAGERGRLSSYVIDERGNRLNPPAQLDDFPLSGVGFSADDSLVGVGSSSGWWRLLPRSRTEHPHGVFIQKLVRIGAGIRLTVQLLFNRVPRHDPVRSFAISAPAKGAKVILVGTLNEWGTGKLWTGEGRPITNDDRDFTGIAVQVAHPRLQVFAEAYQETFERGTTLPFGQACIRIRTRESAGECTAPRLEYLETPTALAWSPDGGRLAVGTNRGNVAFLRFDPKTLKLEADVQPSIPAHRASITVVRWNRKGNRLLTAAEDNQLIWWDIAPDEALNRLASLLSSAESLFAPNEEQVDPKGFDLNGLVGALRVRWKELEKR